MHRARQNYTPSTNCDIVPATRDTVLANETPILPATDLTPGKNFSTDEESYPYQLFSDAPSMSDLFGQRLLPAPSLQADDEAIAKLDRDLDHIIADNSVVLNDVTTTDDASPYASDHEVQITDDLPLDEQSLSYAAPTRSTPRIETTDSEADYTSSDLDNSDDPTWLPDPYLRNQTITPADNSHIPDIRPVQDKGQGKLCDGDAFVDINAARGLRSKTAATRAAHLRVISSDSSVPEIMDTIRQQLDISTNNPSVNALINLTPQLHYVARTAYVNCIHSYVHLTSAIIRSGGGSDAADDLLTAHQLADKIRKSLVTKYGGKAVSDAELAEVNKLRKMMVYEEINREDVPIKVSIIGTRFVHTEDESDKKSDGKVKARCVAQGFRQIIPKEDTYSPVVLFDTLRLFVIASVIKNMHIKQYDVSSAYLHSPLEEPVYVRPPKGVEGVDASKIWKCNKALYGLKNAGRAWYMTCKEKLEAYGFHRTGSDQGLFTRKTKRNKDMYLVLYVDDLLIGTEDIDEFNEFKNYMSDNAKISLKDLGDMKEFCGVQFEKNENGFIIHQKGYLQVVFRKFSKFLTQKPEKIPFRDYIRDEENTKLDDKGIKVYQELLGCLIWLAGISRPDISFTVSKFGSLTKEATEVDLHELKRVLMYLKLTEDFHLVVNKSHYPGGKVKLYAFSDASFGNETNRRSRTGFIIYTNGTPVSWKSTKQHLNTTSTYGAEYVALSHTVHNLQWTKDLLGELGIDTIETPKILEDNQGVVHSVNGTGSNPGNNKHVDLKEKHVQDRVQKGDVVVEYVNTQENVADIFTKALPYVTFGKHSPYLQYDEKYAIRALFATFTLEE